MFKKRWNKAFIRDLINVAFGSIIALWKEGGIKLALVDWRLNFDNIDVDWQTTLILLFTASSLGSLDVAFILYNERCFNETRCIGDFSSKGSGFVDLVF